MQLDSSEIVKLVGVGSSGYGGPVVGEARGFASLNFSDVMYGIRDEPTVCHELWMDPDRQVPFLLSALSAGC